jgi:hypothetical protein
MSDRDRLIELIQNAVNGCARHWAEIIADYLLANGVVVSPLKLGDKIYKIFDIESIHRKIVKIEVSDIEINYRQFTGKKKYFYNYNAFTNDDFGKTVFLTKEEAEEKLKELK